MQQKTFLSKQEADLKNQQNNAIRERGKIEAEMEALQKAISVRSETIKNMDGFEKFTGLTLGELSEAEVQAWLEGTNDEVGDLRKSLEIFQVSTTIPIRT
jgi:hypothetical protein